MKFCVKCGNQLNDTDCFCSKCGTPCGTAAGNSVNGMPPVPPIPPASEQEKLNRLHEEERKEEQAKRIGTERICPFCGYKEVPLFAISCPKCHKEFNSTKVDESIKKFFDGVNSFSSEYRSDEDKIKIGLTWCLKVILILFGALLLMGGTDPKSFNLDSGFPLYIIGGVLIAVGIFIKPPLSSGIKKKRNYIETFIIPNNKESVIEFLILAASQLQNGTNPFTSEGRRTALWNKVWKTKIRQTISKANILFTGDSDAQEKVKIIEKQYKIH